MIDWRRKIKKLWAEWYLKSFRAGDLVDFNVTFVERFKEKLPFFDPVSEWSVGPFEVLSANPNSSSGQLLTLYCRNSQCRGVIHWPCSGVPRQISSFWFIHHGGILRNWRRRWWR